MPRLPRLDAPGAVHHVMARGIERREIFHDDADRNDLLDRLDQLVPETGARVFAWALMPNHVHYVIRTGDVPISVLMKRLHTGYAVCFNLRHERVGYLFQNRFRSRLVTGDDDLRGLVRYVHLNPLRGGLVAGLEQLERYPWTGHGALAGSRPTRDFESVEHTLALFGDERPGARTRLASWMRDGIAESEEAATGALDPPARAPSKRDERADRARLEALAAAACTHFGVSLAALRAGTRMHRVSCARALVCYVAVARWRIPAARVAAFVGTGKSAVGPQLVRGKTIAGDIERAEDDRLSAPARRVIELLRTVP